MAQVAGLPRVLNGRVGDGYSSAAEAAPFESTDFFSSAAPRKAASFANEMRGLCVVLGGPRRVR